MSAYEYRIRGNYNLQSGNGCIPFRESILKHILHTFIQLKNSTIYMCVVIVCMCVCMYVYLYVCMYVCMY